MKNLRKIFTALICIAVLFTTIFSVSALAKEPQMVVVESGVNIRDGIGTTSTNVIFCTETEMVAEVIGSGNDGNEVLWYNLKFEDESTGYTMAVFTSPYDPDKPTPEPEPDYQRVVVENGVNIRKTPVSGEVVLYTNVFTDMALLDIDDKFDPAWYHVKTDEGIEGYVLSTFAHIVPESNPEDVDGEIEYPETSFFVMCNNMSINLRKGPGLEYDILGEIWPCRLPCYGKELDTEGKTWYKIHTPGGLDAYIREDFVEEFTYSEDKEFEKMIEQFPDSYKDGLRHLHTKYPNWVFEADPINITLDEAVNAEAGLKTISNLYISIDEDWRTGTGTVSLQNGYRHASKKAIRYVMEPSNFIVDMGVFMFMDQNYDPETQTKDGVKKLLKGTFMDSEDYADYIMEAAEKSGVNPYALLGVIFTEVGYNGNDLTSGTFKGYEGYYNFFGLSAAGKTKELATIDGLKYAVSRAWKTPKAAIIGGAEEYGANYVKFGQYTYYYKNFNVKNEHYYFQFSTDILDQMVNASMISGACTDNMSKILFKIPVYKIAVEPEEQKEEKSPQTAEVFLPIALEIALASLLGIAALIIIKRKKQFC